MRWSGVRCAEIFFGRSGKFRGATSAAEVESLAVMDGLRRGPVRVNRHPADRVFFDNFYMLLHFATLAEALDSRVWYKTLE
jgi:hypothetical protein